MFVILEHFVICLFRRKKFKNTLGLTTYNAGKKIRDFLSSHLLKFAFHQDILHAVQIERTEYLTSLNLISFLYNLVTRAHDHDDRSPPD